VVTQCEPDEGQEWTDGLQHYVDDGSFLGGDGRESCVDLVEYIGPFPVPDQSAEIERLKAEWTAEIARLQTDWKTEFSAAQQLRSENDRLRAEIERVRDELRGYAAETHRQLRTLQQSHDSATATLRAEQRGAQAAFLAAIKAFLEASR
jgi:septal ring factor EnvC (AmiA/AmiB activator)